ncbi:hypothetical protein H5410_022479 [Solanum commersonii]|uniref:Uncharacterized protein n=1 Tax=Solanum commersonii TaxID=4109 RepID=A0A9J5ZJC6_SOLCO|nr:hypothetical protein H5410_022479 [Solanum commersonii]
MASHPMSFFQDFWEMLKDDILQPLQNFHSQQVFERSFNATYVALIPNKVGAIELRDHNWNKQNHWLSAGRKTKEAMESFNNMAKIATENRWIQGFRIENRVDEVLANILGYGMEMLPTVYLGMPLGSKHKALEIRDGIIEKTGRSWHCGSRRISLKEAE